jgi:hypothetical protein
VSREKDQKDRPKNLIRLDKEWYIAYYNFFNKSNGFYAKQGLAGSLRSLPSGYRWR